MNAPLKALLFDVDGTLADTEDAHRVAFNQAFQDFGFDGTWDTPLYTRLLAVTGGCARMRHFLESADPAALRRDDPEQWIAALHARKTELYVGALNAGRMPLRPGVGRCCARRGAKASPWRLRRRHQSTPTFDASDWLKRILLLVSTS